MTADVAVEGAPEVADAPAPDTQTTQTPELTPHQQFLEMLPEDIRTEPTFADFKGENINEVIGKLGKSYMNTKKLVGADKAAILKIPSSEEDKAGWNDVYTKLGRPGKPEEYGLAEKYKDVPGVSEDAMKNIASVAFENGVSAKALDAIVGKYFEDAGAITQANEEQLGEMQKGYVQALEKEWGGAYEQNTGKVLTALKSHATPGFLDLAKENPHIFDHPDVMLTLNNFLKMSSEDSGPSKGSGSGDAHMTPAEAQAAINAMDGDAEAKKILTSPEDPRRAELLAKRTRLFSYAYPGK